MDITNTRQLLLIMVRPQTKTQQYSNSSHITPKKTIEMMEELSFRTQILGVNTPSVSKNPYEMHVMQFCNLGQKQRWRGANLRQFALPLTVTISYAAFIVDGTICLEIFMIGIFSEFLSGLKMKLIDCTFSLQLVPFSLSPVT